MRSPTPDNEIKKQVSLFMPLSHWKALRAEAARRRIPMTEVVREWITPHLAELLRKQK